MKKVVLSLENELIDFYEFMAKEHSITFFEALEFGLFLTELRLKGYFYEEH